MDLPSLLIGAAATGIIEQIINDLARRRTFQPVHHWLQGEDARLCFECALAQAVRSLAIADQSSAPPLLDWRCLLPKQVASALAKTVGVGANMASAQSALTTAWSGLYPRAAQYQTRLNSLSAILIDRFKEQLSQDQIAGAILWAQSATFAEELLRVWQKVEGATAKYPHEITITLRQVPAFWSDLTLTEASHDFFGDIPFVVRVNLNQAKQRLNAPIAIYPGEQALLLLDGQRVAEPLGPGALDPNLLRRRYRITDRGKRFEGVIYGTDNLFATFAQVEARSKEDQRVLVTCQLRFTITNIVAFQAEVVRRSTAYSLSQLRNWLATSVEAAIRQFVKGRTFEEVDSRQAATEYLEAALEQELARSVHNLKGCGLRYDGLVSCGVDDPAKKKSLQVKDSYAERIRVLEEERKGLSELIPIEQDVLALRKAASGVDITTADPLKLEAGTEAKPNSWRFPPEGTSQRIAPICARPVIRGERLYVADQEGIVYCLHLASATPFEGWRPSRLPGEIYGDLLLVESGPGAPALLVPCTDGHLYLLHPETGATLDAYRTEGRPRSAPLLDHGWVYLSCAAGTTWGGVVAFRLGDGKEMGRWQSPAPRSVLQTPILDGAHHRLYFATLDEDGRTVYCADARRSGETELLFRTAGVVRARLVLDEQRECIYVASYAGVVHALKKDGVELWKRKVEGPISAAGTLADNVLYLGTEAGTVYGLNLSSKGADIWPPFRVRAAITATPAVDSEFLHVGSKDGNVYLVDKFTGKLCGEMPMGGEVLAPLLSTADGRLVVGCGGSLGGCLRVIEKVQDWIA